MEQQVQKFCQSLPGTTEDMKWGHNLVFSVGEKMYALLGVDQDPVALSFKTDPEQYHQMINLPGIRPAPYLARAQWVAMVLDGTYDMNTIQPWLKEAHQIILAKLSKKKQREIMGEP